MKAKTKIIITLISLIIVLGSLYLIFKPKEDLLPIEKPFSETKEWLNITNKSVSIDVERVTEGQGFYLFGEEQLISDRGNIVIFYNLFYYGNYSKNYYEINGKKVIAVGNEFNKSIPSLFVIFKYEESDLVSYVFVNDAFINRYGNPNIIITDDITTKSNVKEYSFKSNNKIEDINIMKIDDDFHWLNANPVNGRMFIGTINKEDVLNGNYEDSIFIMIN